ENRCPADQTAIWTASGPPSQPGFRIWLLVMWNQGLGGSNRSSSLLIWTGVVSDLPARATTAPKQHPEALPATQNSQGPGLSRPNFGVRLPNSRACLKFCILISFVFNPIPHHSSQEKNSWQQKSALMDSVASAGISCAPACIAAISNSWQSTISQIRKLSRTC